MLIYIFIKNSFPSHWREKHTSLTETNIALTIKDVLLHKIKNFCITWTCIYLILHKNYQSAKGISASISSFSHKIIQTSEPNNIPQVSKQKLTVKNTELVLPDRQLTYSCLQFCRVFFSHHFCHPSPSEGCWKF